MVNVLPITTRNLPPPLDPVVPGPCKPARHLCPLLSERGRLPHQNTATELNHVQFTSLAPLL